MCAVLCWDLYSRETAAVCINLDSKVHLFLHTWTWPGMGNYGICLPTCLILEQSALAPNAVYLADTSWVAIIVTYHIVSTKDAVHCTDPLKVTRPPTSHSWSPPLIHHPHHTLFSFTLCNIWQNVVDVEVWSSTWCYSCFITMQAADEQGGQPTRTCSAVGQGVRTYPG